MKMEFKKLSFRFLVLAGLVGGLFFSYNNSVSANPYCEWEYQSCMDGCPQGHGPCYAACYNNYQNCIFIID